MTDIPIQSNINLQDLLKGLEQLDEKSLDGFLQEVLRIRAQKTSQPLPQKEEELLQRIQQGLAEEDIRLLDELIQKRDSASIDEKGLAQLEALTQKLEEADNERLLHLIQLAKIRKISLQDLMNQLKLSH